MKFLVTFALTAVALAESLTTTSLSAEATVSAQQTCLAACNVEDVNCKAACVGVPHPDNDHMNQLTECVANCDQGDGSAAGSAAYSDCSQSCINKFVLSAAASGPTLAPGSGGLATSQISSGTAVKTVSGASTLTTSPSATSTGVNGTAGTQNSTSTTQIAFAAPTGSFGLSTMAGSLGLIFAAMAFL